MNVSGNDITLDIGASSSDAVKKITAIADALKKLRGESGKGGINLKLKIDAGESKKIDSLYESLKKLNDLANGLSSAESGISRLASALSQLKSARPTGKSFENLSVGITLLNNSLKTISEASLANLDKMTASLQRLAGVNLKGFSSAMGVVNQRQPEAQRYDPSVLTATNPFRPLDDYVSRVRQSAAEVRSVVSSVLGGVFGRALAPLRSIGNAINAFVITPLKTVAGIVNTFVITPLKAVVSVAKTIGNSIKTAFSKVADSVKTMAGKISDKFAPITRIFKSIGRIAFTRTIRAMIKAIAEAFKEGLGYAYEFSSAITGEGHRFSTAMDSISSSTYKMKAQLGSAFIGLLTAIQPIIDSIIAMVTKLADSISQLFAAFTGGTYLKASNVSAKFADNMKKGAGSAKEWKNQLLGFDEINRLNEPSSGGSGAGATGVDAKTAFADTPIESRFKTFVDTIKSLFGNGMWKTLGAYVGEKVNELFPSAETFAELGTRVGEGLDGAFQTITSFLSTVDFSTMGDNIATFINNAIDSIDFGNIGKFMVQKFTIALDFFSGLLGTLNWGSVGISIGNFFRGAFDTASVWLKSKDWRNIGDSIFDKFKALIEGIDFKELARSFFSFLGTAFGAIVLLIDGFFQDTVQAIKDYFKKKTEEAGGDTWEGFKKGVKDAWSAVKNWVKENIVDPFVNAVKDMLGIHSPSTVFSDIGGNIIAGLTSGISDAWNSFSTWIDGIFGTLIGWCQTAHNWLQDVLDGIGLVNNRPVTVNTTTGTQINHRYAGPQMASGGFPSVGEAFIARESGPELVGRIGNRNAVANNDQIVEGIRDGVYDAVVAAMSQQTFGGDIHVYIDSREIRTGQNRLARAMGV